MVLAGLVLAQDGQKGAKEKEEKPDDQPRIEIPDLTGMQDDQQEMVRLFHEVELTLESIDLELFDASAGRIPVPEGRESGIERLLRSNGEKSDHAVTGIERILEIAQRMGGKGGT
jgi:hypothetical protein